MLKMNVTEQGPENHKLLQLYTVCCNQRMDFRDYISRLSEADLYMQSPTGNVFIDVGGVSHHVRIANFRPRGLLPCSRLGRLFRAKTKYEVNKYCDDYQLPKEGARYRTLISRLC